MNALIALVMFVAVSFAVTQVMPVVKSIHDSKIQAVAAAQYKAETHKRSVELCASGKGNAIIYNGVRCAN